MSGILSEVIKLLPPDLQRRAMIEGTEIVVEITEAELQAEVTRGLTPTVRDAVTVKLLPGKMLIKIKLA